MTEQASETAAAPANGKPPEDGWLRDPRKRAYIKHDGRAIFRRGDETVEEALARAAAAPPRGDKRPRRKAAKPKLPPAPAHPDLKQIETMISEALHVPAMAAGMAGDEWAANHFTTQAPMLARNLVLASEHNPWLRRKLEAAATGQDAAMAMVAMAGLAGAAFAYAAPPIIWWLNLPVPPRARTMFNIPPAREPQPKTQPPHAPGSESAPQPESAAAA